MKAFFFLQNNYLVFFLSLSLQHNFTIRMITIYNNKEQEQTSGNTLLEESELFDLVLFNDDVNTFDWVIECLISICEHDEIQAEQSAYIVHYKGKCTVRSGEWNELEVMQKELSNCGLSADIL